MAIRKTALAVEYLDDLTRYDALAIEAFISARTIDPGPASTALHSAVLHLRLGVTDEIPRLDELPTAEAQLTRTRVRLRTAWNGLVAAAEPWTDHPLYDHARWQHIDNCDQRPDPTTPAPGQ